jgi:hypothetical protein
LKSGKGSPFHWTHIVSQAAVSNLDDDDDDDDIIEIEPDQVKYHSGETPHPNRVDPGEVFQVMSEAEDDDFEEDVDIIVEVSSGQVHYHEAIAKQMGLLLPPKTSTRAATSKSPSPHNLAIISDFIDSRKSKELTVSASTHLQEEDRDQTPEAMTMMTSAGNLIGTCFTLQESSGEENQLETATITTVHVQEAKILHEQQRSALSCQSSSLMTSTSSEEEVIEESTTTTEVITEEEEEVTTTNDLITEMQEIQEEQKHLFVSIDNKETKVLEELFDKLVAEESVKIPAAKPERSQSFDSIESWLLKSESCSVSNTFNSFLFEESSLKETNLESPRPPKGLLESSLSNVDQDKLVKRRNKRDRNKTLDYSSLQNNSWYNVTSTCTSKTFTPNLEQQEPAPKLEQLKFGSVACQTSTDESSSVTDESAPETPTSAGGGAGMAGRKQGLCLIIDKLKNIETKLDELKTLDQQQFCSYAPTDDDRSASLMVGLFPEVGPTPTQHSLCDDQEGSLMSTTSPLPPDPAFTSETTSMTDASMNHYSIEPLKETSQQLEHLDDQVDQDDEDTLKDEDDDHDDANSNTTDISHTTELLVDEENIVVSSPAPTPCPEDECLKSKKNSHDHHQVDIMSIGTMSEVGDTSC